MLHRGHGVPSVMSKTSLRNGSTWSVKTWTYVPSRRTPWPQADSDPEERRTMRVGGSAAGRRWWCHHLQRPGRYSARFRSLWASSWKDKGRKTDEWRILMERFKWRIYLDKGFSDVSLLFLLRFLGRFLVRVLIRHVTVEHQVGLIAVLIWPITARPSVTKRINQP